MENKPVNIRLALLPGIKIIINKFTILALMSTLILSFYFGPKTSNHIMIIYMTIDAFILLPVTLIINYSFKTSIYNTLNAITTYHGNIFDVSQKFYVNDKNQVILPYQLLSTDVTESDTYMNKLEKRLLFKYDKAEGYRKMRPVYIDDPKYYLSRDEINNMIKYYGEDNLKQIKLNIENLRLTKNETIDLCRQYYKLKKIKYQNALIEKGYHQKTKQHAIQKKDLSQQLANEITKIKQDI